jgi:hypothetical protein
VFAVDLYLKEKNEKEDNVNGSISLLDNVQSVLLISNMV